MVNQSELRLVPPVKNDKVLVIGGKHAGQTGILIGTDSGDGIVKMHDIDIVEMKYLARFV